jgi:dihydrofolate reductase
MRKLLSFHVTSLDGYYEGPNQAFDWPVIDEDFNQFAQRQLDEADMLLFGRVTYQMMAGYWPTPAAEQDDPAVTAKMNAMAKIVISRTLRTADWAHTQLVGGDAAGVLAKLKQRPGKNMLIMGSSALTASLIGMGLVDEVRVMVIDASGLSKHNQVVAMLKDDHGLAHGAAHRVSLLARQRHDSGLAIPPDPADALYVGAKSGLRPLHDALLGQIRALGAFDIAPKKGYLSLRRRKQFAMVQPSTASRIDLGMILPATTLAAARLEPAAKFNPLFTHRVRITAAADIDDELRGWLATAYALAE